MGIYANDVQKMYMAFFNRPADPIGLAYWEEQIAKNGGSATVVINAFSASNEYKALYAGKSNLEIVDTIYQNLFGRPAETAGLTYWTLELERGNLNVGNIAWGIMVGAKNDDAKVVANKLIVATEFTAAIDEAAEILAYNGLAAAEAARTFMKTVGATDASLTTAKAAVATTISTIGSTTVANGTTYTLTVGADVLTGTANNDTFNASETTAVHWSVGDTIDGGAGTDTLNITQSAAITAAAPVGATVKNVETVNYTSGAAITANVSAFAGLTKATATNSGANNVALTGAATTDLSVTNATLGAGTVGVDGGKNITVSTGELVASAGTGGAITIGGTTAAAGTVTVSQALTSTNVTNASTATGGAINVTGGTVVKVDQTIAPTTAAATTALTGSTAATITGGKVTVTGNASTTDVVVTQSAAVAAVSSATIGRVGIVAGDVDVLDANRASTTAAGTIKEVTITNAGAAVVNSGALTTLNLGGTLTTVNAGTLGALTTAANSTLALNLAGAVSTGAVTIDTDIKTLNVAGNTTASTLQTLDAQGATKINVSGDAKVTFTNNTTTAVTDIVVTNTAGAAFGTAIGTGVNFTGGAGADSVVLSNAFTKAITMGAGNDTVTYGGAASTVTGAKGSVAAGEGTDTIIMTTAQADAVDADSVFNSSFTGFETLRISDAHTTSIDLDGINAATKVVLAAGSAGGTIGNLASGGTVDMLAEGAGNLTVNVKSALVGGADVLNVNLLNTTAMASARTLTAANVETINIGLADAAVAPALGSNAVVHTMTLAATGAKTVTVTGNNGLTLTNTGNTAITTFDASGVVANNTAASTYVAATTDSAANLAVTFASANNTASADVTIKGGAGNDVLTGNISKDTISGGAGADSIFADNQGTKEIQSIAASSTDGAAVLTVNVGGVDVSVTLGGATAAAAMVTAVVNAINAHAVASKFVTASAGAADAITLTAKVDGDLPQVTVVKASGAGTLTLGVISTTTPGTAGTAAVDVIDGGAGADFLVGGGGADTITTGTGADTVFMLKGHSNLATMATITDFTYAVGGTSNDIIVLGDVTSVIGTVTTVQDLSAQATLAAAMDAAALANTNSNGLSVFVWGGNEYAYVETTGATGTYQAGDFVVKLTGTPLAVGATIAGTGFDAV